VGTIILALSVLLWFLATYPHAPPNASARAAIEYSYAGQLGLWMQPLFAPLGFNWQMCIALIPAMAAREVAVSALAQLFTPWPKTMAKLPRADQHSGAELELAGGAGVSRVVCLRAAMYLDDCRGAPRNQFPGSHGILHRLFICVGVFRGVGGVSSCTDVDVDDHHVAGTGGRSVCTDSSGVFIAPLPAVWREKIWQLWWLHRLWR
jgi:hypothetical protein